MRGHGDSRNGEKSSGRFLCGDAGESVAVDLSASVAPCPDLRTGDTVRVTGVAILDIDNCRPSAAFPQARGYIVVPASADGLAVVARARHPLPPVVWYVLGALLAAILGVGLWNRSLHRLAQALGRDLAREEIARAEADLRTVERMRISVELHDALSQSLAGVALELEAALRTDGRGDALHTAHLARAGATLAVCREELHNCLWDLRSIVRMGLASLFATTDDILVVGAVGDGASALQEADRLRPDVILLDFLMPGMNGLEVTAALLSADPARKILILTTFGEAEGIRRALAAGARGAVLKSIPFDELVASVRTVAGGGTSVSPEIRQVIEGERPLNDLSPRQKEILQSVSHGLTNEAIAANLGISVPMVRQHLQALFAKIGASNRAEAVAIALRRMLLKI